jgi:hypothetical protein
MASVHFMPWCPLDREYAVGEVLLIPFDRTAKNDHYNAAELAQVLSVLTSYRDLAGCPNRQMTFVKYGGKPVFADLASEEYEIARELVELACFCGIAKRKYFNVGDYCNSTNFTFYGQRFTLGSDHVGTTSRRGDGETSHLSTISKTVFSVPLQASSIRRVTLDESLMASLASFRQTANGKVWSRWQNAIACFNLSNTDAENIAHQVEWTLLSSAFERLLDAESKALDVATKFSAVLRPASPLPVSGSKRKPLRCTDTTMPLSFEWVREFYSVRGDFAHGKLSTGQPLAWGPLEHLVLARIAFPLLVRCLLSKAGEYVLTDDDQAEINAFECLADSPLLDEPPACQGTGDSWWSRCLQQAYWDETGRRAAKYLEEHRE